MKEADSSGPSKPPGRLRRLTINAMVVAVSVVVALLVLEIAFRLLGLGRPSPEIWQVDPKAFVPVDDPELVFMFRPGLKSRIWNAPTEINSLGMRAAEIDPQKPPGEFRILMLGDSVAFGISVRLEDTYSKMTERLLNKNASGHTYRVYNAGVPSYNTAQEYRFLARLVEPVQPDLVVLNFTIMNDYETPYRLEPSGYIIPTAVRREYFIIPVPLEKSLGRVSNVYRFLIRRYRQWKIAPHAEELVQKVFKIYRENLDGWRQCKENLIRIKELLEPRGVAFALFIYPEPSPKPIFTRQEYRFLEIHKKIKNFCDENGIAYLDLLDDFLAYPRKRQLFVAPTDAHPSVIAHDLVAHGLVRELHKRGLLPDKGKGKSKP